MHHPPASRGRSPPENRARGARAMRSKRLLLIVNPRAGRREGRRVVGEILPILEAAGFQVVTQETTAAGHAGRLAAESLPERFGGVVVVGGDGTVHEVVNGLMKHPPEERALLGVIPAGTGNSLMHDLGCLEPRAAARRLCAARPGPLDLLEVRSGPTLVHAFNVVGWGMWAEGNRVAERLRWAGRWRYDLAALVLIARRPTWRGRLQVHLAEGPTIIPGPFAFVLGANTIHTGRGMRAAPSARLDDGRLDLLHVGPTPRHILAGLFPRIYRGRHLGSPCVSHHQVPEFAVAGIDDGLLNLDGELVRVEAEFRVRVLPAALRLLGAAPND